MLEFELSYKIIELVLDVFQNKSSFCKIHKFYFISKKLESYYKNSLRRIIFQNGYDIKIPDFCSFLLKMGSFSTNIGVIFPDKCLISNCMTILNFAKMVI